MWKWKIRNPKFEIRNSPDWVSRFRVSVFAFGLEGGFTLIELLLVVAISLISLAIAVPYFARSFQSTQLRTACREFVSTHKYTRSMAVLNQQEMAILVDTKARELEVVTLTGLTGESDQEKFLEGRANRAVEQVVNGDATAPPAEDAPKPKIRSEVVRQLPPDVKIVEFTTHHEEQQREGVYWINYYANGMGDGFEVTLADKEGKQATVKVEPISGGTKVVYE